MIFCKKTVIERSSEGASEKVSRFVAVEFLALVFRLTFRRVIFTGLAQTMENSSNFRMGICALSQVGEKV
ncbi:hypothetical protein B1R32_11360 [Abditibacterium utsteinense]|uniref:Uncharacterized protein n=1 Tax=Abditibacterium utsteinense TaxID=1960156 RepID=A0A2S8SRA1_9BACT|nr:hypothetical protein B1R32_11360 [Abditibacterium utsteinense]